MRRTLPFALVGLVVCSFFALRAPGQAGKSAATAVGKLPGARPAVEAIDFPSLQAAIDAVPAEGGVVRLPPGKFEIAEPLVISKSDVHLEGSGSSTQIVNTNADGKPALIVAHPEFDAGKPDRKKNLWRVQISNLQVTGNEKSGHGITAHFINEIFIQGVTVSRHGGHGIVLDYCYEDPRVNDSLITYNKQTGLEILGCHDIVVCGNHFEENLDALRCIDAFNLCMTGNNVDDHLRHGVVIENTYGSVVSGNMIEECQDTGIILDRDCYGITLSANVIAHEMKCGIDLRDAHGCSVTGNSFPLVHHRAVVVGKESGRIPVVGNAFSDSYIGTAQTKRPVLVDPAGGLVIEGSHVTAVANTFTGLATKAVEKSSAAEDSVVELNIDVDNGPKK
jgi:hypothetical protein